MNQSTYVSLRELKQIANNYLLLDDDNLVEIPIAVCVANKLPTDPLWMFITGPPSNAKTEILMALDGHKSTYFLGSLTPNTLLSGKQAKDDQGNKIDCSLLPKITGKILVVKDFTTILGLRDDTKAQVLSQLRDIYDGQTSKAYGTGDYLVWKGKIGLLAAVTPVIDKHMSVNQLLGERFLHYRTSNTERFAVAKRAMANMLSDNHHREKFHDAMLSFMERFNNPLSIELVENDNINHKIAALAVFCASARSSVSRNRYNQTVDILPQAEGPARLAKQLKLLASSLAIVRGLPEIDEGIYETIKKVARDSMPGLRLKLLDALWSLYEKKENWYTTKEIAMQAGVPTNTTKLKLENMMLLDLIERNRESETETAPYIWAPSKFLVDAQNVTDCLTNKIREEGKKEEN